MGFIPQRIHHAEAGRRCPARGFLRRVGCAGSGSCWRGPAFPAGTVRENEDTAAFGDAHTPAELGDKRLRPPVKGLRFADRQAFLRAPGARK